MDNRHLFHELEALLRMDSRYCMEDGTLIKNKIVEDALAIHPQIIKHLLSHPTMKKQFFTDVEGALVFDKVKFQNFVTNKSFLADSYTSFKNRVGLTVEDGRFISDSREVVLSWPYKDCMLEGGQTKEDAKRDEIFWNETLAPEEVNRLKEPKVMSGFKKYDSEGEHPVEHLSHADNLVIKGNNLLALYSLKKTAWAGKIKLIYIDPPYYFVANKKEDTFNYNSNFKLSTWCTFMRDRLEVARELLSDDGAIFVQISDDGVGELHLLLKEIFNRSGENNFINKITVKTKSPSGFASVNPGVFETAEYILAFAKHKSHWKFNQQYVKSDYDKNYCYCVVNKDKPHSEWKFERIETIVARQLGNDNTIGKINDHVFKLMIAEYALENRDKVFRLTAVNDKAAQIVVEKREYSKAHPKEIIEVKRDDSILYLFNGQEMAFYSKKVRMIDGELCPSIQLSNIWTDTPYEGIAKEGGVKLKGGKKPEKLLRRIIEMATNEGDIVMDFFAGSGTTAATAAKLNRRFVTCEQLNSQTEMLLKRLSGVTKGDLTGISKTVGWQGGGSFVYCELAKSNMQFVDEILEAKDTGALKEIWHRMEETGYLNYRVDAKAINEAADDFEKLTLNEQKQFLTLILDKNLLYVPSSEIDSSEYGVSAEDKRLTKEFYAKR